MTVCASIHVIVRGWFGTPTCWRARSNLWSSGGPFWARGFYAVAHPVVASAVKRMYKTTDVEGVAKAKQRFVTTFDELDVVLAKQPFLGGDAPNRSDITLVALLAPVGRVSKHRMQWPAMPPGKHTQSVDERSTTRVADAPSAESATVCCANR